MNGDKDTLRDEYPEDLIRSGVRGKYAKRYREGTNIVLIDPDLHKLFPDSEAVNRALREYASKKRTAIWRRATYGREEFGVVPATTLRLADVAEVHDLHIYAKGPTGRIVDPVKIGMAWSIWNIAVARPAIVEGAVIGVRHHKWEERPLVVAVKKRRERDARGTARVLHWQGGEVVDAGASPIRPGEAVVALGFPLAGLLASEVNVSIGNINAQAGLANDITKLQISVPVQPGNSGGPLLDEYGNVTGVVVQKLDAVKVWKLTGDIPQNVNFAVKGEIAQLFLGTHKISIQLGSATKKLEPAEVATKGRAFTVLIECLN